MEHKSAQFGLQAKKRTLATSALDAGVPDASLDRNLAARSCTLTVAA
jgi:hypothetical protein